MFFWKKPGFFFVRTITLSLILVSLEAPQPESGMRQAQYACLEKWIVGIRYPKNECGSKYMSLHICSLAYVVCLAKCMAGSTSLSLAYLLVSLVKCSAV